MCQYANVIFAIYPFKFFILLKPFILLLFSQPQYYYHRLLPRSLQGPER